MIKTNTYEYSMTSAKSTNVWQRLVATRAGWASPVLRITLALMMFPHGAQKLLGWFGGYGFSGTMKAMSEGLPSPVVFLVIIGEFFAPVLLIVGFATRFAAASVALIMAGAAYMHKGNGFFMNWLGNQAGEGIEFHILAIGLALALTISGGGSLSVDKSLTRDES